MNKDELEKLFIKYVCHVGGAEGTSFATYVDLAPCDMLDMEYTEQEEEYIINKIFSKAIEWDDLSFEDRGGKREDLKPFRLRMSEHLV